MRSNISIRWLGYSLVLTWLLLACGPKKRTISGGNETRISGTAKHMVMDQVARQQLHYTTFNGRAKSNLTINEKDRYDVTANVRIVHDEAIWISVTALMGVEVARVLITPDSIKVINRLTSEYVSEPFAYLRHFTGSGLDFKVLEQLLMGGVIDEIMGDDLEVWQGATGYTLQRQANDLQYVVRVGADYQNRYTSIAAPARGQHLEAYYADYGIAAGNSFPNQLEISIATPQLTLQSAMKYSKVVYNEKIELPFTVPSRYTEVQ